MVKQIILLVVTFYDDLIHKWRHGHRKRGKGFCDDITEFLVLRNVTIARRFRDVIYGLPLNKIEIRKKKNLRSKSIAVEEKKSFQLFLLFSITLRTNTNL